MYYWEPEWQHQKINDINDIEYLLIDSEDSEEEEDSSEDLYGINF